MQMNEPSRWQTPGAVHVFTNMVVTGQAIELTHLAPKWLCRRPVAVEAVTYDRFVAWDAAAQRRHGILLEEANRLEHLFDACGTAAFGAGGCFICKAVDAQGYAGRCERHVLTVTNYGEPGEPLWLIHL